jgi:hypothetical protein
MVVVQNWRERYSEASRVRAKISKLSRLNTDLGRPVKQRFKANVVRMKRSEMRGVVMYGVG